MTPGPQQTCHHEPGHRPGITQETPRCQGPDRTAIALPGPKMRPQLGARQRPAARQRRRARVCGSAGSGQELAGAGVDGLDSDLVAEAFQALDVVAGLTAGVHAGFVVVGAEVGVLGVRVG
jgi:hypothetical protein